MLSSFIRNFMRIVDSFAHGAGYLTGLFMIFFHPKHKRVGDLVSQVQWSSTKGKRSDWASLTPVEKEIQRRGLSKTRYFSRRIFNSRMNAQDWNLCPHIQSAPAGQTPNGGNVMI